MGNFTLVIPKKNSAAEARAIFEISLQHARVLKNQTHCNALLSSWADVCAYRRLNGSGGMLVKDPETESWLLAIGTWFHKGDAGRGAAERLLRRYLQVGSNAIARELDGFFVITIGNARTQEVLVITDPIGSCHCYMRQLKYGIALSGSSLLLASFDDYRIDPIGCQEFLATGVIYEDRTFYHEVRKLAPATIYNFSDGTLQSKQTYWKITNLIPNALRGQTAVREVGEQLVNIAGRIAAHYPNPVCDLTGGYDSRALVAAFLSAKVEFATTVSGPPDSGDVQISKLIAQKFNLKHRHICTELEVSSAKIARAHQLTDGEYDILDYVRILETHETLSKEFGISLNGSFGEIARGYWWELLVPRTAARMPLNAQKVAQLRYAATSYQNRLFPPELRLNLVDHFAGIITRAIAGMEEFPNTMQMDQAYLSLRMQRWQGRIATSTNQIWPCYSPFMSREVLELILQTEPSMRRFSLLTRKILITLQPELASVSLEFGYPATPFTLKNCYRFWPIITHWSRRLHAKVTHTVNQHFPHRLKETSSNGLRLQRRRIEEVQGPLNPRHMISRSIMEEAALIRFLEESRGTHFQFQQQWGRLFSLEYTLQKLSELNAKSKV